MDNKIPKFYRIVTTLISEIAKERGEDPEEFRELLLAKVREGEK